MAKDSSQFYPFFFRKYLLCPKLVFDICFCTWLLVTVFALPSYLHNAYKRTRHTGNTAIGSSHCMYDFDSIAFIA